MSIRAKTKRRLLILLGGMTVVGLLLGGGIVYRMQQISATTQANYEAGVEAFEQGDYVEAMHNLDAYVRRTPGDVDATYKLAYARRQVETRDFAHLSSAIDLYNRVLDREPGHLDAQRELIEIYTTVQRDADAVELGRRLLQHDSEDVEVMLHMITSLARLRQLNEALTLAEEAVEIEPTNLDIHERVLQILQRLDRPNQDLLEWAQDYHEQFPEDPRFEALLGLVYSVIGQQDNADLWLFQAAERDPEDPAVVRRVVMLLTNAQKFRKSMELLERAAERLDDEELTRMLARRLWEQSRYDDLRAALADIDVTQAATELVALKAAAEYRAADGDAEAAEQLADALEQREGDNAAQAWAPVLKTVIGSDRQDARQVRDVAGEAVAIDSNNPYIRIYLGEALSRLGETELAISEWQMAARLSSTWALPHIRLAQAFNNTGRRDEALGHARAGSRRAPNSLTAAITVAEVLVDRMDHESPSEEYIDFLVDQLQRIRDHSDVARERTLPTYVRVLAVQDRERAVEVVNEALADEENPLSEQALVQLAEVSRRHELGVTERLIQAAEASHGSSPNVAYAHAMSLHAQGDTAAGREAFRQKIDSQDEQGLGWQLAFARFLDVVGDDEALQLWRELAEDHPENVNVQRTVLSSSAVEQDRELMESVIGRIRELSGERGLTWRMAQARFLLADQEDSEATEQAVQLLREVVRSSPGLVEPRLLLAQAQQQANDLDGAIEELTLVLNMQSDDPNPEVMLDIARLRTHRGDFADARRMINRVLNAHNVTTRQRRVAGNLLAHLGEPDRAIELLTPASDDDGDASSDLLRAELHVRRDQPEQAERLYDRILDREMSADAVRAYMLFLGSQGRHDEAREVLDQAAEAEIDPGALARINAEFARRFGDADEALVHFQQAIEAAPDDAALRRELIAFHLDRGKADAALEQAAEARAAMPNNPVFELLDEEADLIRLTASHDLVRPVVRAIIEDDRQRDAAVTALRLLRDAEEEERFLSDVLRDIRDVADRNPRALAVQMLAVDLYLGSGDHTVALTIAERAADNFPNHPAPAERATRVVASQGNWSRALRMAERWRDRELHEPIRADVAIAEAQVNLSNYAAALARIEPYVDQAEQRPDAFAPVIRVYGQSMVGLGRYDEAADRLEPLLPHAAGWRNLWIGIALDQIEDRTEVADWLERVESHIPSDSFGELASLGRGWFQLGQELEQQSYREHGFALLQDAVDGDDVQMSAVLTYAVVAHQMDQEDVAEAAYRRVLAQQPNHQVALNNLAMLLAERGENLDEALELAERAVEENEVASFYDTLAFVQIQRGEHSDAIGNLERAIELEPNGVEWRVNLAMAHHRLGEDEQATLALQEIDRLGVDIDSLSPRIRSRLEELRRELEETRAALP